MARAFAMIAALVLSCSGPTVYDGHGVVRDVSKAERQVMIEHDDIEGLMPAMTMNFDVAHVALLDPLEPGQVVDFTLAKEGRHYRITGIRVVGTAEDPGSGLSLASVGRRDPAPAFELLDQNGEPLALADLRGKAVVLDFIFTHCPGPCPILTGILADVQKALAPTLRERTWFVSVSVDPVRDTPAVLREYARQRSLDLSDWSLLTGEKAEVESVLRAWGVGVARQPDGEINHLVAIFLVDPEGRIAERYVGLEHGPEEIAADLARILS